MSMNLNACTKKLKLNLWQTPTSVSYTILPPSTGCDVKGKKAQLALESYCEWVKGHLNGCWNDQEAYKQMKERVEQHLIHISPHMKDPSLQVWIA